MSKVTLKYKKCAHHWIIDAADTKTSYGRCKYCGLVRTFSNEWQNPFIKRDIPRDKNYAGHDSSYLP